MPGAIVASSASLPLAFMLGSALVALATSFPWLVAARVFQAVGAGAMVPISIAVVGDLFPPNRRGIPLGIVGASAEAGGVIGPLWGGRDVRYLDWQWVFWVNIPLGAVVLVGLVMLLRPSPRHRRRVDYLGGALITLSLVTLTLGLARVGDPDPLMAALLVGSVVSLLFFILRQRVAVEPLLPPSMFRAANSTHLLVGGALIIGMVTIPLMANTVLGQAPLEGGLRLTSAIPIGAVLGGIACQRMDFRMPTITGLGLAAVGFFLMSGWGLEVSDPAMTVPLVLTGLGFGLVIAPIALATINSVDVGDRGTAAALITAMRLVGMTSGLATLAAWGSDRFQVLAAGLRLPLRLAGETATQAQQRVQEFEAGVTEAGLILFNEFFLVAMAVSLVAILPAALMAWRPGSRKGTRSTTMDGRSPPPEGPPGSPAAA